MEEVLYLGNCQDEYGNYTTDLEWWAEGTYAALGSKVRRWFKLTGRTCPMVEVQVTGPAPSYAGWEFLAKLEPVQIVDAAAPGGTRWVNLVHDMPGKSCPEEWRAKVGTCEHCGCIRRRKETFVVHNVGTGCTMAVGRQCIKDFLGGTSPDEYAQYASYLATDTEVGDIDPDEYRGWHDDCPDAGDALYVLAMAISEVNQRGWLSASKARELCEDDGFTPTTTAGYVRQWLRGPNRWWTPREYTMWEETLPEDKHFEEARVMIEWILAQDVRGSDYLYNLQTACRTVRVPWTAVGLLCSLPAAYRRAMEEQKPKAEKYISQHVGTVKKREEFTVTCKNIYSSEGTFGTTGIHRMVDEAGNVLVWFASGSATWLDVGYTYRIKATVKNHDVWEKANEKQTILSRVAILEELHGEATDEAAKEAPTGPDAAAERVLDLAERVTNGTPGW